MNFISREAVMAAIERYGDDPETLFEVVQGLPSFPAPNPNGLYGRNVLNQTEEEFWAAVDARDKR